MKRLIAILIIVVSLGYCFYLLCKPAAAPTTDLASPSQEIRSAAAKVLRANAKPPWRIKWFFFTQHLKAGESETNILNLLRSYNLSTQIESGMGGLGEYWEFRLDDYWLLGVVLNNNDYKNKFLERWKLVSRWRAVAVWPSTNFTGYWINYYANGNKFTEGHYQNGFRSGAFTTYEPDGLKNSVWHYDGGKANGMWMQYFPSGQIQVQCLYSNQMRVGDRVWFYTNGYTQLCEHYDNGKLNGPKIIYFPSGKIKYQCLYSNSERVGIEVIYKEDGTTNSVKDFSHP